jgi:hypothetical protein
MEWAFHSVTCTLLGQNGVMRFLPDVYESTAIMRVEQQHVPEVFVQAIVTSGLDLRLQTITPQVLSHSRVEELINRFDFYADMRQRESLEEVIETMRQNIVAEQKGKKRNRGQGDFTVVFINSYKDGNPSK